MPYPDPYAKVLNRDADRILGYLLDHGPMRMMELRRKVFQDTISLRAYKDAIDYLRDNGMLTIRNERDGIRLEAKG